MFPSPCPLEKNQKAPTLVCMQDLGADYRPDSLSEIPPQLQEREAEALADIHFDNLQSPDLGWGAPPIRDRCSSTCHTTCRLGNRRRTTGWRSADGG